MKQMHHVCIQTDNYQDSLAFYREVLGFELVHETPDFHNRDFNTWLRLGDFMIELQTAKRGDILTKCSSLSEGIVHMCFLVDNLQEEYERIRSTGFSAFKAKDGQEVYQVNDGSLFKLMAPEGTVIEFRDTQI